MAVVYNSQLDAFELYHRAQEKSADSRLPATSTAILRAVGDGLAGSAGSAISNVVTYPLDLIITRLQIQRQLRKDANVASQDEYKGFKDAAQKIIGKDGFFGLYAGLLSDTGKTITDSFLFFLMYDFLRRRRLNKGGQNLKTLPAFEELAVGFVAGSLTKLCTTPISNIVTRKQAAAFTSADRADPSVSEIASDIMTEKGISGFWSGYSASLVLTLNPSLTFFLFETLKRIVLPKSQRDNPPASATFLLAAISKACASSVTYPFSLAKARLQAGGGGNKAVDSKHAQEEDKTVDEKLPSLSANNKTSKASKKAARTTIFSTLLTIANQEGIPALYEGLHLEILKAFFSHGTTMLVKQVIQKFLIKAYYIFRIVYNSWTGQAEVHRERLAAKAKKSGYEYYDLAIKRTSQKMDEVKTLAEQQLEEAKERGKAVAEFVSEYVPSEEEASEISGGILGKGVGGGNNNDSSHDGDDGVGAGFGDSTLTQNIVKWIDSKVSSSSNDDGEGS